MKFLKVKNFQGSIAEFFLPRKEPGFLVIFFNGLPPSFSFIELAKIINNLGGIFIQPYYPGSWFSAGEFSVSSVIESVHDWLKFLKRKKIRDQYFRLEYRLNYRYIFLIGLSFGTYPIIKTDFSKFNKIIKVILVNPVLSFSIQNKNLAFKESIRFLKKNLFTLYKNIYRISSKGKKQWLKLLDGRTDLDSEILLPPNTEIYLGELDDIVRINDLKKLKIPEGRINKIPNAKHGGDSLLKIPWENIIKTCRYSFKK